MDGKPKLYYEGIWDTESFKNYTSFDQIRKQLYRGNWSYLSKHPELRAIIRVFLHELIDKQPENIYEFSASLFSCNNSPLFVTKINQQLKRVNEQLKQSGSSHYDGNISFIKMESTYSSLSRDSISTDIDNMLRYAILIKDKK